MHFDARCLIGLAGVHPKEHPVAIRAGKFFEWPLILVAIWLPIEWFLEVQGQMSREVILQTDWIVWGFFFIETVVTTSLVDNKLRYLRCNWINLFIIIAGLPMFWGLTPVAAVLRSLRLVLLFGLIVRFSRTLRTILARNQLGYTMMIAGVVIMISGFIIAAIEPGINDPGDGMWWALVTITTVGYGDITPATPEGRAFGALLIITGVILFSLLTASIAAYLIDKDVEEEVGKEEDDLMNQFYYLNNRLDKIEKQLRDIRNGNERDEGRS
jgi:voltage-gated potassium channel